MTKHLYNSNTGEIISTDSAVASKALQNLGWIVLSEIEYDIAIRAVDFAITKFANEILAMIGGGQ